MRKLVVAGLFLLTVCAAEGQKMRTVNFRDGVLHAVAYKLGLDPEQSNFLTNQAIPIGTYIDEWVRRVYTARDWPEWIITQSFIPVNHVVPWDTEISFSNTGPKRIGRPLKVYLVDPSTTDAPVETAFTLRNDGIFVGYDHGTTVWVKYIPPAPRFTAVQWRADNAYRKDDTVYSYTTGECYKSKVSNNINHDPAMAPSIRPPRLSIEETQALVPADQGIAAAPQIVDVYVNTDFSGQHPIQDPLPNGDEFTLVTVDTAGTPLSAHSIMGDGSTSIADLLDQLKLQCDADSLPGFTFTVDGPNKKMRIESTTTEFSIQNWQYSPDPLETIFPLKRIQVQPLQTAVSPVDITPQQLKIVIGDDAFIPGGLYSLIFTDNDGTEHPIEYQSDVFDNVNQIFNGLALAIGASTDPIVANVAASINTSDKTMTLSLLRQIGVEAQARPPGNPYWEVVPFPLALADQVIRGAYADLLKEWGQSDKGSSEEQAVPAETTISEGHFDTMPSPPLTGQQRPMSRYKVQ